MPRKVSRIPDCFGKIHNQGEVALILGMSQSWVCRNFQKHKTLETLKAACADYKVRVKQEEYNKKEVVYRVDINDISEGSWEKENLG